MNSIIQDFPFFNKNVNTVFLDSAASSQKPKCVIDQLVRFYSYNFSNIHRGSYDLSERATENFEKVRHNVAAFINATSEKEIIFTKNATEGINLISRSFGELFVSKYDEILVSSIEHHSNIVPWQQLCVYKQVVMKIIPVSKIGNICINAIKKLISHKSRLIVITCMSNIFGSIVGILKIIKIAKKYKIKVFLDACQSISHTKIDVVNLDCDFLVFSSHKVYGPTSIGVLYGKSKLLNCIPVYQTGGSMIQDVSFNKTIFLQAPFKFEAGTLAIAEVIAFGESLNYLNFINFSQYWMQEKEVAKYIRSEIRKFENFKILGGNEEASIITLVCTNIHYLDVSELLNKYDVSVRSGYHCAKPLMDFFNIPGVIRISLGIYNSFKDANYLIVSLHKISIFFL